MYLPPTERSSAVIGVNNVIQNMHDVLKQKHKYIIHKYIMLNIKTLQKSNARMRCRFSLRLP
jgi:hypothetical protein